LKISGSNSKDFRTFFSGLNKSKYIKQFALALRAQEMNAITIVTHQLPFLGLSVCHGPEVQATFQGASMPCRNSRKK
jgi:hypothetical protein